MAAFGAIRIMIMRDIVSSPSLSSLKYASLFRTGFTDSGNNFRRVPHVTAITYSPVAGYVAGNAGQHKSSARLSQVQQMLHESRERAYSVGKEPIPKITLDRVNVTFTRSGGPGGQNVNKVNTKVRMRFNVKDAHWLSPTVRERIMKVEKNRINKGGEIMIYSTKTRTQKGNTEDALAKLQAIINAASYVPPPPSEEQAKKITKIAAIGEQKRMQTKKALSHKKASRRSPGR